MGTDLEIFTGSVGLCECQIKRCTRELVCKLSVNK